MKGYTIRLMVVVLLLMAASLATAQDWARKRLDESPRHHEWVDLKSGDRTLKCFVAYPEIPGKATVVVLIHENVGLTDWVMSVADRLAEHGYIAVAPDFLSGMAPGGGRTVDFEDLGKVRETISGLPSAQVVSDLNAACDYALKIPSANGKIVVGGFCWGGSQTFLFAAERPDLSAGFVFYGTGPSDEATIAKISCPIYGFYGGNDNRVNATIPTSERLMKAAGKTFEPVIYEGAGHGFMRAGEAPDASEANRAAKDAGWSRWLMELKRV